MNSLMLTLRRGMYHQAELTLPLWLPTYLCVRVHAHTLKLNRSCTNRDADHNYLWIQFHGHTVTQNVFPCIGHALTVTRNIFPCIVNTDSERRVYLREWFRSHSVTLNVAPCIVHAFTVKLNVFACIVYAHTITSTGFPRIILRSTLWRRRHVRKQFTHTCTNAYPTHLRVLTFVVIHEIESIPLWFTLTMRSQIRSQIQIKCLP